MQPKALDLFQQMDEIEAALELIERHGTVSDPIIIESKTYPGDGSRYQRNKEKIKARALAYYYANREDVLVKQKSRYRKLHPQNTAGAA